jgi:hypothetical protein
MRGIFTVKNKKIRRRLYLVFSYSRCLLPIFRVFSIGMPGLSGVNSGRFGSKCRGIWRYDNPFVPALIHYDAKQDKGMLS